MSHRPVCFLDVDGVLADFWRGVCAVHRVDYDRVISESTVQGDDMIHRVAPSVREFWAPLGHEFWRTLPELPDGRIIAENLDRIFEGRVALLTSPPLDPASVGAKLEWVAGHFPAFRRRVFVGPEKRLCAHPKALLVDDWEVQCDKFRDAGGAALLLPRPWNSGRAVTDPVTWLNDAVFGLIPALEG